MTEAQSKQKISRIVVAVVATHARCTPSSREQPTRAATRNARSDAWTIGAATNRGEPIKRHRSHGSIGAAASIGLCGSAREAGVATRPSSNGARGWPVAEVVVDSTEGWLVGGGGLSDATQSIGQTGFVCRASSCCGLADVDAWAAAMTFRSLQFCLVRDAHLCQPTGSL